jgi:hypothetical protein
MVPRGIGVGRFRDEDYQHPLRVYEELITAEVG